MESKEPGFFRGSGIVQEKTWELMAIHLWMVVSRLDDGSQIFALGMVV